MTPPHRTSNEPAWDLDPRNRSCRRPASQHTGKHPTIHIAPAKHRTHTTPPSSTILQQASQPNRPAALRHIVRIGEVDPHRLLPLILLHFHHPFHSRPYHLKRSLIRPPAGPPIRDPPRHRSPHP